MIIKEWAISDLFSLLGWNMLWYGLIFERYALKIKKFILNVLYLSHSKAVVKLLLLNIHPHLN